MMPLLLPKYPPQRLVFKFGNRQKSQIRRIWGMRNDLKAAFSLSSHSNERCGLVHYLARAEHLKMTFLFFPSQSPDAVTLGLHNMHHLLCGIKIIHHDNILTIPKDKGHHLFTEGTLLNFLGGGEPDCFHCKLCFLASGSK